MSSHAALRPAGAPARRDARAGRLQRAGLRLPMWLPMRPSWRLLWGLMLVLHLWPLVKVGAGIAAGDGGWGAFAALAAAQVLFALKSADVRWLRMPSRRGAVVAFLLATAFAHPQDALQQLGQASKSAAVVTLAAAPAVASAAPGRRFKRWLSDFLRRGARAAALWRDAVGVVAARCREIPRPSLFLLASCLGRAPPATSLV